MTAKRNFPIAVKQRNNIAAIKRSHSNSYRRFVATANSDHWDAESYARYASMTRAQYVKGFQYPAAPPNPNRR